MEKKANKGLSASFVTGAIALIFLIVGFQIALFINKAAISKVEADRSAPDTVYIVEQIGDGVSLPAEVSPRKSYSNSSKTKTTTEKGFQKIYEAKVPKKVESFRFNPNTVSIEDLQRLGFSEKQAQSIENYRAKGGSFRRKSDFAKSYVVSDSVYARLEPYIDIPLTELNTADSAAFDALPGIGGYFASKMVEHRRLLGGYSYKEQLMDIYRFDEDRFAALEDLISVDTTLARPYPLWTLPEDSLALHPYIGKYSARSIVFYRENNDPADWTVEGLSKAGILKAGMADKLSRCRLAAPDASP